MGQMMKTIKLQKGVKVTIDEIIAYQLEIKYFPGEEGPIMSNIGFNYTDLN